MPARGELAAFYLRDPDHLPRDVQLLLSERIARTLAGGSDGPAQPRLFAGFSTPPAQAVRAGRLLEELACGLGTLVLEVPPLRERQADLPGLVEHLLERACSDREVRVSSLSPAAWSVVRAYSWPGNVRELYSVLRTACAQAAHDQLDATDLPAALRRAVERDEAQPPVVERTLPLEQLLEEAERRLILLALQRAHGQKARAARLVSIPRPRLWRRMLKLGIVDSESESDVSAEEPRAEE
jgi:DNA-binding NtrC family response regulator